MEDVALHVITTLVFFNLIILIIIYLYLYIYFFFLSILFFHTWVCFIITVYQHE